MAGSADSVSAARINVIQYNRLLPLGKEVQLTRLERMFYPFAIPLLACPDWLLEWRASDHTGFNSQRGRSASGRHRVASNNGIIAGTRLPRVRRAGHQLRRMDRCAADACGERFPICGVNVADRKR